MQSISVHDVEKVRIVRKRKVVSSELGNYSVINIEVTHAVAHAHGNVMITLFCKEDCVMETPNSYPERSR